MPSPRLSRLYALCLACLPAGACAQTAPMPSDAAAQARATMVTRQIAERGVRDARVLEAMRAVPRHLFVPDAFAAAAYDDRPLPIGHDQTISQPYIVARMTELARPQPGDRVLEIGTGSGYQAAVLAELVGRVYTIEIVAPLGEEARERLLRLGYDNVDVRIGDGYAGWPEQAPFDAIVVTAAPETVPAPLIEQLKRGGRMVVPVGPAHEAQELRVIEKRADGTLRTTRVAPVRFVPFTRQRERGKPE